MTWNIFLLNEQDSNYYLEFHTRIVKAYSEGECHIIFI